MTQEEIETQKECVKEKQDRIAECMYLNLEKKKFN